VGIEMLKNNIIDIINRAAENSGYLIYESHVMLKGENTKLIVKIDSQGIVSHNDCDIYSRELSLLLDESGLLSNYFLEISSPGTNRKIRDIEEFIRFKKAPVKVVYSFEDQQRVAKGILSEIDENGVEILEEKNKIFINHRDIVKANLDY
jgi:ribosome maturation factor RimP